MLPALYHKLQTQFSAPDDGRNYRPKHIELIEIINKTIIVASSWLFILLKHFSFTLVKEKALPSEMSINFLPDCVTLIPRTCNFAVWILSVPAGGWRGWG